METQKIKNTLELPKIIQGCMRISSLSVKQVEEIIDKSMSLGVNFFDHADIYGGGKSHTIFAQAFKNLGYKREDIVIQSKTSINRGYFDSSKKYIMDSVDSILKDLNTDYLDILLLHRADILTHPSEIAQCFNELKEANKVKYFGVSNHNSRQIELLNKYTDGSILINQVQLSIAHCPIFDSGIYYNTSMNNEISDDGLVQYSMLNDITLQAWSPFQYGYFEGTFINNDKFKRLNSILNNLAEKYSTNANAIAAAWILNHPANIQVVSGATSIEHIIDTAKATDVKLTKEEWYSLYTSTGKDLP